MDNRSKFSFTFDNGETVDFTIKRVNQNYYIEKETPTVLLRQYELPSGKHPLGLDNNGMDVMTRLMYGGQVSLLVGFIVVIIEVVIGVIVGGVSGYFGGAVDTALMRFVDLFNSIPFYPVVIILGSVMDTLEVDPMARIFILDGYSGYPKLDGSSPGGSWSNPLSAVSRISWLQRKQPVFAQADGYSDTLSQMLCRC